ncbi:MAG: AAA family ATPase [Collinsella sp.]
MQKRGILVRLSYTKTWKFQERFRMKRQAIKELQRWKASPRRKPLIVSGARQVGKTWLMKEFGNTCFERFAYVTFDDNPQLVAAFGALSPPQRLLPILQAEAGVRIDGSTLLILDRFRSLRGPSSLSSTSTSRCRICLSSRAARLWALPFAAARGRRRKGGRDRRFPWGR